MLIINGINIYTKTMITCDEDLAGQIYAGREEHLEDDAMHLGTEADVPRCMAVSLVEYS